MIAAPAGPWALAIPDRLITLQAGMLAISRIYWLGGPAAKAAPPQLPLFQAGRAAVI